MRRRATAIPPPAEVPASAAPPAEKPKENKLFKDKRFIFIINAIAVPQWPDNPPNLFGTIVRTMQNRVHSRLDMVAFRLFRPVLQKIVCTTRRTLQSGAPYKYVLEHTLDYKRNLPNPVDTRPAGARATDGVATFPTAKSATWVADGPIQSFLGNLAAHAHAECTFPYFNKCTSKFLALRMGH